ncbi:cyclic-phosphate processing receiver domain-containing protein [Paenibacillus silvestris]|uniref:cyclic-phosphate processing receiver domain-containing protein n=1 Tax=Paenibacillus silvestris TaxID=2606219 RepID=UPI001F1EBAB6|nr:cyclic-phosphate processing receiver domain-containing protein [Paenibacillus silvestris]
MKNKTLDNRIEPINLFVDDLRDCPVGFTLARNFEQAIEILRMNTIDILTLDHDLGEDEHGKELPNGYDLVKYFCEHGLRVNRIYLHTDNPVGRNNMYETLLAAQRRGFIASDIEIYHYPITENKYSGTSDLV